MPGFELFGDEERQQVQDVLDTGVLMRYGFDQARQGHWKARTFEQELAARTGVRYCHLCASGTAALNVALAACGIGAGDEVIIPPFTFVATFESVLTAGAVPVFSEIDDTLCLDPEALADKVSPRTKAVMVVHMCGAMAQIDRIADFCRERDLILIEDACQSIGGTFGDKALGTFGHMGCFSFDPVKTITCGEGGAVITDDETLYRSADAYADHGHDHIGSDRGREGHPIMGLNYRISELNAAVGLAQLRKLDHILQTQRKHKRVIRDALANVTGVEFRRIPDPAGDTATFLSFMLPDEQTARKAATALADNGIDGCFHWYDNNWHYVRQWTHLHQLKSAAPLAIHLLDQAPDYENLSLPQSDRVMGRTLSMLIKLGWTAEQLHERADKTTAAIRGVL